MTYNSLIGEIKKLPRRRRLEMIDQIYCTLDEEDALTAAQKTELRRRFAYYKKHPEEFVPLAEVKAELKRRAAKR